ncbi:MAG: tetratricopeptide repeat protein, partial [Caldilineaceae bacterium]|nr:tetratricopeptide repeat protein [Caldilineaceae bacterium]
MPEAQLAAYLSDKRCLLILDNFEHLLDAAPGISDLLIAAPGVDVLVTSREALRLQEEWFHPIAGLSFPDRFREIEIAPEPATYDAVHLFEMCSLRAQPTFSLSAHWQEVVHICQLVDGMPLGIELAATWLSVLSISAIATEIERNLDILTARHRNMPKRHSNMRAVLEQSWAMLAPREQEILARLSLFRGSFDRRAAEVVAETSLLELTPLFEKALLRVTPSGRYLLHELLRQFTLEKLAQNRDAVADTGRRHARYYLDFLHEREYTLYDKTQSAVLDEVKLELDNIRAAWSYALEVGDVDLLEKAATGLHRFFTLRSRFREGRELLTTGLLRLDSTPPSDHVRRLRAQLQLQCGSLLVITDAIESGRQMVEQGLANATDTRWQAFGAYTLGWLAKAQGNRVAAIEQLQRSRQLSQSIDDLNGETEALIGLSDVISTFVDYEEGAQLGRQALALARRLGRPDLIARALDMLAWATNCMGNYDEAESYWQESLEICRAIESLYGVAINLGFLGWTAYCNGGGHLPAGLQYYQEALTILRQIGDRNNLAMTLGDIALASVDA